MKIALMMCCLGGILAKAENWPGPDWPIATPESQGMSAPGLAEIKDRLAAKKTRAFLVVRNDQIVYEWYAPSNTVKTRQGTASLAKALVGGLSLAVAITDGKISIDDPAAKFVPQWKDDPRKSKILVRHLGSHTSGLADSTTEGVRNEQQPGWLGEFWQRLNPPHDPFTLARDTTPLLFAPGEKIQYSNPGIGMMAYCVTAAIRGGAQKDLRALLRERVFGPIGIAESDWFVGYGQTTTVDGLPLVATWGGAAFTPRATARLGRLVLHQGQWEGHQILSPPAVRDVTGDAGLIGHCGMGWWSNGGRRYEGLPPDAVWGAGAGDQLLLVIPSLKLIMVRNGELLVPGPGEPPVGQDDVFTKYHDYRARILFEPLVKAVTDVRSAPQNAPGLPPHSSVIKSIRWAPAETTRRAARGSDNWPLAWADDDALYGAYGDGNGFEPLLPEKLSMGFARIMGGPDDFNGTNLRSPTGETVGDGRRGLKASGMVCVDRTLYLSARNAANSKLAWSPDHGVTWNWLLWSFTESFGAPAFLDFGKNNQAARDAYVYLFSHDHPSAYRTADQIVLARVPRQKIRDREAYEFFAGNSAVAEPRWSREVSARQGVLALPGQAYRTHVTYDAPLRRYFMVQAILNKDSHDGAGQLDSRFHGGLAVFDAPEPWGPWTTAFFTETWDVPPGDSASFPSKWISINGRTLHLVFSSGDNFAVRRADLELTGGFSPRPGS